MKRRIWRAAWTLDEALKEWMEASGFSFQKDDRIRITVQSGSWSASGVDCAVAIMDDHDTYAGPGGSGPNLAAALTDLEQEVVRRQGARASVEEADRG